MPVVALEGFVDLMYPVLLMGLQTSVWDYFVPYFLLLADKMIRLIHPLQLWVVLVRSPSPSINHREFITVPHSSLLLSSKSFKRHWPRNQYIHR